jgi:hypothetical protein
MNTKKYAILIFLLLMLISCSKNSVDKEINISEGISPKAKLNLWNQRNFDDWFKFVPNKNVGLDTIWFNKDNLLHCTGNPIGYIRTTKQYQNYKLTVIWRWPEEPGNSGVLLHIQTPDTVWPKFIEAQLMSENAGDFYIINGTDFIELINKDSRRLEKKETNSENLPGEWNKYEIICQASTIELFVNGVFQNKATNCNVNSGYIGFQSEGKPIEFKEIFIEPIE